MSAPITNTNAISEDRAVEALLGQIDDDFEIPLGGVEEETAPEDPGDVEIETDEVETDEAEEPAEEVETEEPADTVEPDDGEQPTAIELETFEDLAAATEIPVEDLGKLRFKFKAAGQDYDLPVSEIVAGFQERADSTKKRQEAAEVRRRYEQQEQERAQHFMQTHGELARQMEVLGQLKTAELNSEEMKHLEQVDPARAVLRKERIRQDLADLERVVHENSAQYQQHQQRVLADYYARETEALKEHIPDWGAENVNRVATVMRDYGFSDQEIVGTGDHRTLRFLNDFAALKAENAALKKQTESTKTAAKKVVEKVKATPKKVPKGKAPPSKAVKISAARARAFKQLKSTGRPEDAVGLLSGLIPD